MSYSLPVTRPEEWSSAFQRSLGHSGMTTQVLQACQGYEAELHVPVMHAGTGKLGDYLPRAGVAARRYRARRDKVLQRLQRGSPHRSAQRSSQVAGASLP